MLLNDWDTRSVLVRPDDDHDDDSAVGPFVQSRDDDGDDVEAAAPPWARSEKEAEEERLFQWAEPLGVVGVVDGLTAPASLPPSDSCDSVRRLSP